MVLLTSLFSHTRTQAGLPPRSPSVRDPSFYPRSPFYEINFHFLEPDCWPHGLDLRHCVPVRELPVSLEGLSFTFFPSGSLRDTVTLPGKANSPA